MPEGHGDTAMPVTTQRIYRGQKAPPLQDSLSINTLDFHEPFIDSMRVNALNCREEADNKKPASLAADTGLKS
jgi:hypothetical protein